MGASSEPRVSRRTLLAGATSGVLAAGSGCVQRLRTLAGRQSPQQVSLGIKTPPTDADPYAVRIAGELAANLSRAGVAAQVIPMAEDELLLDVLVNHDFDLYVAEHPGAADPDFLYPFLHSRYSGEAGWQNPLGYADIETDELLAEQRRRSGTPRREVVDDLQHVVVREQPFTVVAVPDAVTAVRWNRYGGWLGYGLTRPVGYLYVRPRDPGGDRFQVAVRDERITQNLNPLAAEFRNSGTVMGLLYDPLARHVDGELRSWLATDWEWTDDNEAVVTLRDGVAWHDGSLVTATDVAFTYRFLADTSLGEFETPVPAPRFRGQVSLVADVAAIDWRRVRFRFDGASQSVAEQAFTVPVLPEDVWEPQSRPAEIAGIGLGEETTNALVWKNPEPVGSGPLSFVRAETDQRLVLERVDDHFLHGTEIEAPLDRLGAPAAEVVLRVVPSDATAVELVDVGEVDATGDSIGVGAIPAATRSIETDLVAGRTRGFYHVGFNVRQAPLANPRFRRVVARLIDREWLVNQVFGGYATPTVSPVPEGWVADDLAWEDDAPAMSFLGEDGDLDSQAARDEFIAAGFSYNDAGELVRQ